MYIHVPSAWLSMMCYTIMASSAIGTLVWRHPLADVSAKAAAPLGAAFTLLALVTGSLWGKPMWGTWWVWDARLTSVFVLFLMYLGLIALGRAIDDPSKAARVSAVLILVGFVNIPIIKFSVEWWNTLHQSASVLRLDGPTIDPEFLWPLLRHGDRLHPALLHAARDGDPQRDLAPPHCRPAPSCCPHGEPGGIAVTHAFYVYASYGFAALVTIAVTAWTWLDGRARRRELAALEACRHPPPFGAPARTAWGMANERHAGKHRRQAARAEPLRIGAAAADRLRRHRCHGRKDALRPGFPWQEHRRNSLRPDRHQGAGAEPAASRRRQPAGADRCGNQGQADARQRLRLMVPPLPRRTSGL